MKAYLIDPTKRSVDEIDYDGTLDSMYKLLDVQLVDAVVLNEFSDTVFVDDEGLLYSPEEVMRRGFFHVHGYNQHLAGRGLVLGTDAKGASVSPVASIHAIRELVSFPFVLTPPEPYMELILP